MSIAIQQQQLEKLKVNNVISYKEISEILEAFQIASGQGFAIGKTKGLLEFLRSGHSFTIENFEYSNKNKVVSTIIELAKIYKDIDEFVDLPNDKDFMEYFS